MSLYLCELLASCTQISGSLACQVRSQDAYPVVQGLHVEARDIAWNWLKVQSL
jgi:hypothetical protein